MLEAGTKGHFGWQLRNKLNRELIFFGVLLV